MKKEIIISVLILLIVVTLNTVTQGYTKNATDEISEDLNKIRKELIEEETKDSKINIEEVTKKWEDREEKMVLYTEHGDLEKVGMYILEAKSHIETEEYNMAVESIDTCMFVIDHIKEKYKFSLKNIF